jgi:hypothetical protein
LEGSKIAFRLQADIALQAKPSLAGDEKSFPISPGGKHDMMIL